MVEVNGVEPFRDAYKTPMLTDTSNLHSPDLIIAKSVKHFGIARGIRTLTYFRTLDSKSRLSTNSSIATYYGLDGGTRTPILYAPNVADNHYHTSRYYF